MPKAVFHHHAQGAALAILPRRVSELQRLLGLPCHALRIPRAVHVATTHVQLLGVALPSSCMTAVHDLVYHHAARVLGRHTADTCGQALCNFFAAPGCQAP